jgi:hypothetical protein
MTAPPYPPPMTTLDFGPEKGNSTQPKKGNMT